MLALARRAAAEVRAYNATRLCGHESSYAILRAGIVQSEYKGSRSAAASRSCIHVASLRKQTPLAVAMDLLQSCTIHYTTEFVLRSFHKATIASGNVLGQCNEYRQ